MIPIKAIEALPKRRARKAVAKHQAISNKTKAAAAVEWDL
jgi:hypothetical protein